MRSKSAWMMAKVSTDVQVVVEKLLSIVVTCTMEISQDVYAPTCKKISGWKLRAKPHVIGERPLLTPAIRDKHLECCQRLANDLKYALNGRLITFADEKTWTVNPVRNRRNDRYLSLREEDESARTLSKMKHPASFMSLGFVASNGAVMPLN